MKSQALAFSVLLLLGTTLSEVGARPVQEDILYELGMWNMAIYGVMEDLYQKASKLCTSLRESKVVADLRNYVTELKLAISKFGEEFVKELEKEIKKIKKELEKEKRKHKEPSQEKENPPQVAQEA